MIQIRPDPNGYDERHHLALRGTGTYGDGERLKINLGETVTCGRSRHCGWSLKRSPAYLNLSRASRDRLRRSLAWRSTSREHVRISYVSTDQVDVENLSQNGTLVDGHRIDRILLTDCRETTHRIQLGPFGVILELGPGSLPLD